MNNRTCSLVNRTTSRRQVLLTETDKSSYRNIITVVEQEVLPEEPL